MSTRRTAKVAEAIREVVSSTILFELRDPRVKHVTVLHVEVTGDLRNAKVSVSVMGDEREQALTLHGLESARGFLQSKIAERLDLRYTPVLTFQLDQGVKRSIEASRILRELADESSAAGIDSTDALDAEEDLEESGTTDTDSVETGEPSETE